MPAVTPSPPPPGRFPALQPPAAAAPTMRRADARRPCRPTPRRMPARRPPPGGATAAANGVDLAYGAFQRGLYLSAFSLAIPRAEAGDTAAQTLIGLIYEGGYGVPRDFGEAVNWYQFAANGGDREAEFALGMMYLDGRGVEADHAKAADYLEQAAASGQMNATYQLALLYLQGDARPRDDARAAQLLATAAAADIADAEFVLAQLYDQGRGVASDPREATHWFEEAARLGHVPSEVEYAIRLFNGVGTEQDRTAAYDWFRRAADIGNPIAQNRLAHILATGSGVARRSGSGGQVALPRQERRQGRRPARQVRRRPVTGAAAACPRRRAALACQLSTACALRELWLARESSTARCFSSPEGRSAHVASLAPSLGLRLFVMARTALLNVMVQAALKAGRGLVRDFGEVENLQVSLKGPGNFVSAADHRAEETLIAELRKARPAWSILTEESGEIAGTDRNHRFIVDPLDGTTNFLHGIPLFAISIGVERDGELVAGVIYNPVMNELYVGERGSGAFLNDRRLRVAARRDLADAVIAVGMPGDRPARSRRRRRPRSAA